MESGPSFNFSIRSFHAGDLTACKQLYLERITDNDTAWDMEDIQSAYMKYSGNHFWVAQLENGLIVGMVGVQQHDEGVGEIRRLRVAEVYRRRGIGSALVETALHFCRQKQYLKVKLDTFMEHAAAVQLFEKFRFLHDRTRTLGEKQLMYFYLDLYSTGQKPVE